MWMPKIFSGHTRCTAKCVNSPRLCPCARSFTACVSDFREGRRGGSSHTLQSRYWIFLTNQHNKSKRRALFELCPCARREHLLHLYWWIAPLSAVLLVSLGWTFSFLATVIRFHSCYHFFYSSAHNKSKQVMWEGKGRGDMGRREGVSEGASEWASKRWLWNAEGKIKQRRKTKSRAQGRQRRRERKSIPCLEERPTPKVQLC